MEVCIVRINLEKLAQRQNSESHKIQLLSISKFFVYCCHSNIDLRSFELCCRKREWLQ